MNTLKEYVQAGFFELAQNQWTDKMVEEFIQAAANRDTDIHEDIKNIDTDDLIEYIASFDKREVYSEIAGIQRTLIVRAKEEIGILIDEIQYSFDQEDTESQLRSDFERVEGAAINRDRR